MNWEEGIELIRLLKDFGVNCSTAIQRVISDKGKSATYTVTISNLYLSKDKEETKAFLRALKALKSFTIYVNKLEISR